MALVQEAGSLVSAPEGLAGTVASHEPAVCDIGESELELFVVFADMIERRDAEPSPLLLQYLLLLCLEEF